MHTCYLVQLDQPARQFSGLARVALGAARALDTDNPARANLLNTNGTIPRLPLHPKPAAAL